MINIIPYFYEFYNNATEKLQKIMSEITSTIVVINGFATTAGSKWHFFARSGRNAPTIFATTIVANSASDTTNEICSV